MERISRKAIPLMNLRPAWCSNGIVAKPRACGPESPQHFRNVIWTAASSDIRASLHHFSFGGGAGEETREKWKRCCPPLGYAT